MEKTIFSVETEGNELESIPFRTRWLLVEQNSASFPVGDAVGHAACRGRVACGHAACRGRVACGNPNGKSSGDGDLDLIHLSNQFMGKLGYIPSQNASVFDIIEAKKKLLSA